MNPPLAATGFRHALGQFATGVTLITAPRACGQGPARAQAMTNLGPAIVSVTLAGNTGQIVEFAKDGSVVHIQATATG